MGLNIKTPYFIDNTGVHTQAKALSPRPWCSKITHKHLTNMDAVSSSPAHAGVLFHRKWALYPVSF